MKTKNSPFTVAITFVISVLTISGFPNLVSAQTSPDDQSIMNAARALGVVRNATRTVPAQHVTNNQQRQQTATKVKHDPYAARRQQILRQNAARRKAHHQRTQQAQRQKYQKANLQKNQKQNSQHNLWNRVYQGFKFRDYRYQPLVKKYTREFSRSPQRIQQLADRSSDYLFMVTEELNRRRMPTELALLPFVESAYKNTAYSHAGAAGMWQFIPATGRRYGLKQTRSYDARLDSHQATRAALDYLQKLNRQFKGDWLLSLAAYNCGEYRVAREIAKNRSRGKRTDYWSLDLPRETRQYVPRLLAFKEIFRNPRAYRVHLEAFRTALLLHAFM